MAVAVVAVVVVVVVVMGDDGCLVGDWLKPD